MTIRISTWLCLLPIVLLYTAQLQAQTTFPEEGIKHPKPVYTLLKGATIHHHDGLVEQADVLLYEGKIKAYGLSADFSLSANLQVINLEGKHLYPSFIDMKSSYGLPEMEKKESNRSPQEKRTNNNATYWNEAIHPERNAMDLFRPDSEKAEKLRAMGIGAALIHQADGVARGSSALVFTGDGEANKLTLLTHAAAHFGFDKGSSKQNYPGSLMGSIALLRQALYDMQWHIAARPSEANYSLDALHRQVSGTLIFEGRDKYDLHRIGSIANEFDLDLIAYEPGYAYQAIESIHRNIKGVIIPLKLPQPYDTSDPDLLRFVDQADLLHWEWAPYNALKLEDAGIPFAYTLEGFKKPDDMLANLRKLREKGVPESLIINALSHTPAVMLGIDDRLGKIAPGYDVHFFTASGDIFNDKEAKLLQHFIADQTYTINEEPPIALASRYDLNINNSYLELEVNGKHPEYKAEVQYITGSDTTKTKAQLSLLGREVSLAFMARDSSGMYRLSASARSQNRIWDGTGTQPDGTAVKWSAIRKTEKPKAKGKNGNGKNGSKPAQAKSDSTMMKAPAIPAIRYPMSAYGFDSLPQAETLLISNATLWTNTEKGIMKKGQVLIHEGKILAVGHNLNPGELLPKASLGSLQVIDATGMHLSPGIIDEHSHIAISRGVNEGSQAVTSEVRIGDALNPSDINIFRQLSGGVTTSQLLHGSANPIGGQSAIVKLRWGQPYGKMIFAEAPGFIKFALGENVKQSNKGDRYSSRYPQTRMGVEQIFYDYFYRAQRYGEDLKLYNAAIDGQKKRKRSSKTEDLPIFRRDLELEALLEILQGQRHITCHSYVQSEINMLMHVADSMDFKINTFTHILEGYKLADKMAAHGAAGSSFSDWWAYKYEVRDAIPHNGSLMHQAGVLTGFNSDDAEMARRLNQEAAKAMKYGGMDEQDALKLVTLNPAKMMHIDHLVGSISPGMHADLVLWNDHPLSVYAKAEITFVDGCRYFERSKLPQLMQRDQADRSRIADMMHREKSDGTEALKPERKMERYYHCTDIEEQ